MNEDMQALIKNCTKRHANHKVYVELSKLPEDAVVTLANSGHKPADLLLRWLLAHRMIEKYGEPYDWARSDK